MHLVGCGDLDAPLPRERHGIFDFTDRRDSPCGCPLSAQPIQGYSNCNLLIISFYFATHSNQRMYTTRVSAFSFYLKKKTPAKEKQNRGNPPSTPATPSRSIQLAALNQQLGTFARKLASLKQYGLVRLASQAGSALSKHSRLSPLERALCSLFFANIASLHPPPAALR